MNICIIVTIPFPFLAMLLDPPMSGMICFIVFSLLFRRLS